MELKDKLYNLRKKNGYTQSQIAEMLEVSRQSVSNWELGTVLPSTSRLKKLSDLYSVPLETLLNDDVEIQRHQETVETQDKSTVLFEAPTARSKKYVRKKTAIIIVVLGIVLTIGIAVFGFIVAEFSKGSQLELEQFEREKVVVSSENGFDFQ